MCEGPLLLRDEANHRCICTELSHIFAHVFCLKRILHLFISTSLINSSLDRNERCSTCCWRLRIIASFILYQQVAKLNCHGLIHQSSHSTGNSEIAQTINKFPRASFNPKCIFNHTTKAGLWQKSVHCIVHSGMCAGECKLFTYRYGDRQLCYFKIWCCCLETMSCVKPEMAPNIEQNSSHSAQLHPCLHSYWLISKWIQSKIRSLVRMLTHHYGGTMIHDIFWSMQDHTCEIDSCCSRYQGSLYPNSVWLGNIYFEVHASVYQGLMRWICLSYGLAQLPIE